MNRIKDLRVGRGWTQTELGDLLSCSDVTVGRYESEKRGLDVPTICRLCDVFGCTADYLLGRSSRPDPGLTPEEELLLAAWAEASPRDKGLVDAILAQYKKDAIGSEPTA